ncbi:hypothetical protein B0F88_10493 [Methylobacter tundripaludum]|uniref:Uncharacterized protein n=1 Tax=Methylobacter tundripaludum TaxID=173365 RepID=A0A2S6H4F6_9GAMM|nr:hypothetical protein [Methylobacter tundripaludum]PPK72300.1 hypothetical protein B0F88_10493 [Methylobacter tundripaludum]
MDYGKCATQSSNEIITAEEHKRKLIIRNEHGKIIRKIKVDGCLIAKTDPSLRCDYMFEIDESETTVIAKVIYLELKGEGVKHAYDQLVATMERFLNEHRGCKKECYIVSSKVPRLTTSVQQLTAKMKNNKKVSAKLTVKNNQAEIHI